MLRTVVLSLAILAPTLLPAEGPPPQPLRKSSVEALQVLLEDGRKTEALYAAVIKKHGEVRPFSNIIQAERHHQRALEGLMQAHGVEVPPNLWQSKTAKSPDSFAAACQASAQAEIENVALYDQLMKTVVEPDLLAVFERLRWASQERHLPAFQPHSNP